MSRGYLNFGHMGIRLKHLRKEHGMKQAELAVTAGVTQVTISRFETSGNMGMHMALHFIHYFNVNRDWFLFGEGDMK